MKILVSACLLGCSCRYDGASKPNEDVLSLSKTCQLVPVCPEQMGGLATPRPAAERQGARVMTQTGVDVTAQYQKGAEEALRLAQSLGCQVAVLKENSPSCGCGQIHDGTFSDGMLPGNGVTAELLIQHGILVVGESNLDFLKLITVK